MSASSGQDDAHAAAKSHRIKLDRKTRLIDSHGQALANGFKAVAGLMPVGEEVIVKYDDDGATMMLGDTPVAARIGSERSKSAGFDRAGRLRLPTTDG